jgi:tetratricopeptide (TPR) repeat protein
MPYADPEKSFDAAVHHLFRHLADASALRKNPLVRAHFPKSKKMEADDVLLAEIRVRILEAANRCCADDAAAGLERQARRRHAIISAICSGEPPRATAGHLKISRRQYYRERQAICARVAAAFVPQTTNPAPQIKITEPQQLLFSRAAALTDQGLAQRAVTILDQAWSGIPLGNDRFAARLELANALTALGDLARAEKLLEYARTQARDLDDKIGTELRDRAMLIEARHGLADGDDARAGRSLEELANKYQAANRFDETALDALVECGLWYCSNAQFPAARKMLHRARFLADRLAIVAPHRQVVLALLHAHCAEDVSDDYNGSYRRFRTALEISTTNASVKGTIESTIGLMGYYGSVARDDEALTLAQRALEIARSTEGRRHLLFAAAWIATTLLKTRYWRAADPLLFEAERIAKTGTLLWVFIKEAQGDFFTRMAQYDRAQSSFGAAQEAARKLQNRKWQAIVCRDEGVMLKRLGSSESVTSMQSALDLAEEGAGAWTLSLTYRAAAQVLPNMGLRSRARPRRISAAEPQAAAITTTMPKPRSGLPRLTLFG